MITFTPATRAHGEFVAARLRELDRQELEAVDPNRPYATALRTSIGMSCGNAVTAMENGAPIAIFGLAPGYALGEASPWMLGTDRVAAYPRELIKWSRAMVKHWLAEFPLLLNEVWTGNTPAITFLRHAGFSFAPPRRNEYGAEMMLFYARRPECAV